MGRLIKYIGTEPALVAIKIDGDPVEIHPGNVLDVHPLIARGLLLDTEVWETATRQGSGMYLVTPETIRITEPTTIEGPDLGVLIEPLELAAEFASEVEPEAPEIIVDAEEPSMPEHDPKTRNGRRVARETL